MAQFSRGIIRGTKIDDIRVHAVVGHGQKTVLLRRGGVNDFPARHDIAVYVHGIHGVGHQHGIVPIENFQKIAAIGLGAVGNENVFRRHFDAVAGIIRPNILAQKIVALIGAVPLKGVLDAHFRRGFVHRRDHRGRKRKRHVPDAQFDHLFFGMRGDVLRRLLRHRRKQVTLLQIEIIFVA